MPKAARNWHRLFVRKGCKEAGYWLLVAGCWLLVAGCWMLVAGCFRLRFYYSPTLFTMKFRL
ncbi:MAG: hypothetical protein DRJ15_12905 [Bacteroidetes bacterium]|nr:MAG: hypothetical protein DRJ15_12905 [Bacteroidota bacterium]